MKKVFDYRRFFLSSSAAMALISAAATAHGQTVTHDYLIKHQGLGSALKEFSIRSGKDVIFDPTAVKGKMTPGVRGHLDDQTALGVLLQGSGLKAQREPSGGISIISAASSALLVHAQHDTDGSPPYLQGTLTEVTRTSGSAQIVGYSGSGAASDVAQSPAVAPETNAPIQDIVVTGSRIAKPNLDQPTPISTLSTLQIANAGTASLGDIIALLPSVGTTSTERANSGSGGPTGASPGVSQIDLRNLGVSRTLVLVDGQRHVNADILTDAVDINAIPAALVDHVEVITGGASAIYGSDAVSGVVNIILKHNYEGVDISAQGGQYSGGFDSKYNLSGIAGRNFDVPGGGRLNITLSGFYNHEAGALGSQLPYNNNYSTITNPKDLSGPLDSTYYTSPSAIPNDGIADNLTVPHSGGDFYSKNGVLINPTTGLPLVGFLNNGQAVAPTMRAGFNSALFGYLPSCTQSCYFRDPVTSVIDPNQQRGGELLMNYDATAHFHTFLDAKFIDTITTNYQQADYTNGNNIAADNAYITPQLAGILAPVYAAGLQPGYNSFVGNTEEQHIERRTYRIVAGVKGDVDLKVFNLKYDSALNYGQDVNHTDLSGPALLSNLAAALDSVIDPKTGQPACRINVPSAQPAGYMAPAVTSSACSPYDPFGSNQSAAAKAYVLARFLTQDHLSQEVANLNFNTDTSRFFSFQGGPIGVALGGEYRQERTYENVDPGLTTGITDALGANSAGGFNVYEGYVEGNFPIFKHLSPGMDELSFDAAFREAHYSTVGAVDASKVSAIYGPFTWLKLRGTYSRSVRAPDISQAFAPTQGTYFNVIDPCSNENINSNVNYARNCAAAGLPTGFTAQTNQQIKGQSSGNPALEPEKSLSYTGGFVLQPPIIPHLSFTADYYSILISNAITQVAPQDIINNCFNSSSGLSNQYCSLFSRDAATHNINFIQTTYVNAAKLYENGLELQADYAVNIADLTRGTRFTSMLDGRLNLTANLNYVFSLRNYPFQDNPSQYNILAGGITAQEGDVPHLRALVNATYREGPLEIGYQIRFLSHAARFDQDLTQADFAESINPSYAGARFYHDISVRYDLPGPVKGFQVFFGVNDLFGETPPLGLVQGEGTDAAYDLGRYVYGGLRFHL